MLFYHNVVVVVIWEFQASLLRYSMLISHFDMRLLQQRHQVDTFRFYPGADLPLKMSCATVASDDATILFNGVI